MSHAAEQFLPSTTAPTAQSMKATYAKVVWRLMPFLIVAYTINAIDRLNVSFAKLRMGEDIALTDAAYGIGVGAFYLAYILFEIPSNLYMQRVGARVTLTRIMVLWGLVTVGTAFVTTPNQLIAARFLLGIAEAGFFPGVILYLTYWFPSELRGRITAVFLMSGTVAGIVTGPLAGTIMTHLHGVLGMKDWQMLFVVTGLPAVALGLFGWFWLTDRPEHAKWLNDEEKTAIRDLLAQEHHSHTGHGRFIDVLRQPSVYLAGLVFFCIYSGSNTVSYWMPSLIRGFGLEDMRTIGMISALPFALALVGMYLLGRSSDKRQERRWHLAATILVSAACFFALGFVQGHLVPAVILMTIGSAAALSAIPLFWTIPPALLSPGIAAGGIAAISCIGGSAGVVSQIAVGAIKTATGSLYVAFDMIAVVLVVGALILLLGIPAERLRKRPH
ncbi:MFS transporter [Pseudomonas jinjuensis]|uniref:MFS transporter, ACS family, phthalate transporter n=1 Tax=Pseudomonas jinjuensis TaxID=198616 RepID=A0A1H0NM52_9PSED|nr:MFS transporter [Pseudomonas jinjuensis]SDO93817.1 MFS transporter, ACS family, phthalate transporter [Pseudomonas jinjuensis]